LLKDRLVGQRSARNNHRQFTGTIGPACSVAAPIAVHSPAAEPPQDDMGANDSSS